MNTKTHFRTIVIGAGAAGLFFAAQPQVTDDCLILEKTAKAATKLLMSGSGQCNLTHGGSIKEFLSCYGANGKKIRSCLYSHSNLKACSFFRSLGIELTEREDGKIFPSSMDARQVKSALMAAIAAKGIEIRYQSPVVAITREGSVYCLTVCATAGDVAAHQGQVCEGAAHQGRSKAGEGSDYQPQTCERSDYQPQTCEGAACTTYTADNVVVAVGGASYPATGSDGAFLHVLARDLNIGRVEPSPALVPIYVDNYPFSFLSGISLKNVRIKSHKTTDFVGTGDLLLTHRNFSGPVILNCSRYVKFSSKVEFNFIFPYNVHDVIAQMKLDFQKNPKTIEAYLADKYSLPKRFCQVISANLNLSGRKVSTLSGNEITAVGKALTESVYSVSSLGSFREAMVTAGGVALDQVNLQTMESKFYPGLYFVGEVLDIDGDTGGYNLQFGYSSATSAASHIYT